jgi:hypothetical protein
MTCLTMKTSSEIVKRQFFRHSFRESRLLALELERMNDSVPSPNIPFQ